MATICAESRAKPRAGMGVEGGEAAEATQQEALALRVTEFELAGLRLIEPVVHEDARGSFVETFSAARYRSAGIDCNFVQDNHSRSRYGVLRGLHYQASPGQAKLVHVTSGHVFDVVVDIRPGSPTFGRWQGVHLDDVRRQQLFVPIGFAHGLCVLSEGADVTYKVSAPYDPIEERVLAWDDPELGIDWPIRTPLLSDRDRAAEGFAAIRGRLLP